MRRTFHSLTDVRKALHAATVLSLMAKSIKIHGTWRDVDDKRDPDVFAGGVGIPVSSIGTKYVTACIDGEECRLVSGTGYDGYLTIEFDDYS